MIYMCIYVCVLVDFGAQGCGSLFRKLVSCYGKLHCCSSYVLSVSFTNTYSLSLIFSICFILVMVAVDVESNVRIPGWEISL